MKKIALILLLIIPAHLITGQDNPSALELVKILHEQEIEKRKEFILQHSQIENFSLDQDNFSTVQLYQEMAGVYSTMFSSAEIEQMIQYHKSAANQKHLAQRAEINSSCSTYIIDWEKKVFWDVLENNQGSETTENQINEVGHSVLQRAFPDIKDPKALEALLADNPEIINDFRLLVDFLEPEHFEKLFDAKIIKEQ